MKSFKICARVNASNLVVKIYSTALEPYMKGDIILEEGFGDAYCYVPNKYRLINMSNKPRYKVVDGQIVERDNEELANDLTVEEKMSGYQNQIQELKSKLSESDYLVMKYIEGFLDEDSYNRSKIERQSYREQINDLENKIASM